MELKDKIIELRKKNKMTQQELASKLNTTRQSVSKWETGLSFPTIDNIEKLCEIFECSKDELIVNNHSDNKYIFLQNETLGKKIKMLREENNISQEQLADKINVSRQTIFNYENNNTKPDINKLVELSELFNVSLESLLDNKQNQYGNVIKKYEFIMFFILFFISFLFLIFHIDILYLVLLTLLSYGLRILIRCVKKEKINLKKEAICIVTIFSIFLPNLFEFNTLNSILGTGFFKNIFLFSISFLCIHCCVRFDKGIFFSLIIYLPLLLICLIKNAVVSNFIIGLIISIISLFINIFSLIKIIRYDLNWFKKIIYSCVVLFIIFLSYLFDFQTFFSYFYNLFVSIILLLISMITTIINKKIIHCTFVIYIILLYYNIFPFFSIIFSLIKTGSMFVVNELNVAEIMIMMISLCLINSRSKIK